MKPFFSIVIPSYNRASHISAAVRSVLSQTVGDFEVIVVDDGSKDNTAEVMREFTDPRITYIRKENGERGAARNFGAARARGQYINFCDSDDLLYPNHLAVARELIERWNQPEIFHIGYDFRTADRVTGVVDNFEDSIVKKILFQNVLSCNGVFLRRDVAARFPFHEDRVLASSEDWELWIRLLCRFPFQYSNTVTSSVVNHDARSLKTVSVRQIIPRDLLLISILQKDEKVMTVYGKSFNRFIAERYTFFMLCLAEQGFKGEVFAWAGKAIRRFPLILLTRRFLSSIRKSIW